MKIIVRNEVEKDLVNRLATLLSEGALEVVENDDERFARDCGTDQLITSEEYRFLNNAFTNVKFDIDAKERPMEAENDIIVGVCVVCGSHTEGVIDGGDIDYQEYSRLTNDSERLEWKCESCFNK